MAANRDYRDSERDIYATGYNPDQAAEDLVVAHVTNTDSRPRLHFVHYACHPTTLAWDNSMLSPDFVGATRETIAQHTGLPCVYFNGPCGELGPKDGFTGDIAVADRNGRQLGFAALSALESLGPDRHDHCYAGPVVFGATIGTWAWTPFADDREAAARRWFGDTFHVDLPYRPLPNPEALQADLVTHTEAQRRADEVGDEAVARDAGAKAERSRRWLRRIAELPQGAGCPYGFSVLEMGDATWITYSAEPYSTLASELRVQFPSKVIVINPVAGDSQLAYLLPKDRYGIGLYQEEPSSLAAGCLEVVTDAMTKAIESLTGLSPSL